MIQSRRWFLRSSGVLAASAVVGGCSKQVSGTPSADPAAPSSTKPKPPVRGPVVLGVAEYEPYAYTDDDGELTGEVIEVCRAVMKSIGVDDVEVEIMEFETLLPALSAERVDVVGGMGLNAERCTQAAWSAPDHEVLTAFVVPKGNPKRLKTFEEVISSSARLGAVAGAFEMDVATEAGVPSTQLVTFPDPEVMLEAVASGDVDAGVYDDISLRSLVRTTDRDDDLEVVRGFRPDTVEPWYIAFAFREDGDELREAFDEALSELHDSGEWLDVVEKFDFDKDNLPDEDLTADDVCGR